LVEHEAGDRSLNAEQRRPLFEQASNCAPVHSSVALCPGGPNGCALAAVKHAELKRRDVSGAAHDSAKRVHFTNNGTLRHSANGWVARHLPNTFEGTRDKPNTRAEPRGCDGGFCSGVATSDDDHVEVIFSRL
jgi:hypothetical protein